MKAFVACFGCEFKKLAARRKYYVLAILSAVFCVGFTLLFGVLNKVLRGSDLSVSVNIPMTVLPFFMQIVIPLAAIMAVCDMFSSEYRSLSIKAQLMRPVTRFKIYISKLLASWMMCGIFALAVFLATAVCSAAANASADGLFYAFSAYLLDLIPILILIFMASLINQLTKGSTSAMFWCIIIYAAAKFSGYVSAAGSSLLFTSYMEWHKLWLGHTIPLLSLAAKCSLLAGHAVTMFCGGYLLFLKKEF